MEKFEVICTLIEEKKYSELKSFAEDIAAPDLAEILYEIPKKYYPLLFRVLSKEHSADTFVELDADIRHELIDAFNDKELSEMLSELYVGDTVEIIEEMPAVMVKRILKQSSKENRAAINDILRYPKDSAGSIMTTEYVRLSPSMTVYDALAHIRAVANDKKTVYTAYITDEKRHLLGVVSAKMLLTGALEEKISDIMIDSPISLETGDGQDVAMMYFDKYGFNALPVVDSENRLVGIVTVEDVLALMKDEGEEDFAKMAAIVPNETPYLKRGVMSVFYSRIPWLLLLMVTSTAASSILSIFESALPAILVLFVPMIMGTGGNSGGQASVTVTRSLSLLEIEVSDVLSVLWKEIRVGIMCALALGGATFLKIMLLDRLILGNAAITAEIAVTVALSLAVTVLVAKLFGASLPLFAKRVGLDPAVMASPLITTIVDAVSLIVYFFVSKTMLGI